MWQKLPPVLLLVSIALMVMLTRDSMRIRSAYSALVASVDGPLPGRWYPPIPMRTMSGGTACLGAPMGRSQLIYFSSSECEDCERDFQTIQRLVAREIAEDVLILAGVALGEDSTEVRRMWQDSGIDFGMLADGRWPDVFRLDTLPQMVLLDPQGRIRVARGGAPNPTMVTDSMIPLLGRLVPEDRDPRSDVCQPW